ncbi:MAG: glycosyltransferase [Myxococcota bacterium]|nr:glycosyltransferase [Myxococcota bacterium]
MPTLLQIVHGYPPREIAGTEIYAERLTRAFSRRGWTVHVLASTRAPGHTQGAWLPVEQDGAGGTIHRIVNNLPWRPLGQCERDPGLRRSCNLLIAELEPDIIHIQHLLFLDVQLDLRAPTVFHLHDAWAWCPRGGSLLEQGKKPCSGPESSKCIACYGDFARGSAVEHQLGRLASRLSAWVDTDRLHRSWKRLPPRLRGITRVGPKPAASQTDFLNRQEALKTALNDADLVVSPSAFLGREAERHGIQKVTVLPHGADLTPTTRSPRSFLFLGSLAFHKGPDLVAEAWQLARAHDPELPPLRIIGPEVEGECVRSLPSAMLEPAVPSTMVPELLATAHALVLGSRWPENAPLVIHEARAAGCPTIAPAIGGIPEFVEPHRDGRLYEAGSAEALAKVLLDWRAFATYPVHPPPSFQNHVDALETHYQRLIG